MYKYPTKKLNKWRLRTYQQIFTSDFVCNWTAWVLVFQLPHFHAKASIFQLSHKKQKVVLGTRAFYIEILMLSWNLQNGPKQLGSCLKNIASSEGDQLLGGEFGTIVNKIEADEVGPTNIMDIFK